LSAPRKSVAPAKLKRNAKNKNLFLVISIAP
jgi:hypothetical protein